MAIRVGILTSGGDCPGLNATIRGVAKALYHRMGSKVEIVGIMNGYDGLINGNYREMSPDEFSGILTVGGTILGTKRTPRRQAGLSALPGRQRHPQNRQPAEPGGPERYWPAQDH